MHIYLKNNPALFYSDLIWNIRALGFFEEVTLEEEQQQDEWQHWSKNCEFCLLHCDITD